MRKNILFGVFAAATMLLATSCQKEEEPGSEVMVSFALNQPGIATKAYSNGETATKLTYAVYEADSTTPLIVSEDEVTFNAHKQAVVNLRLVTGKYYDILFWADAGGDTLYTFDPAAKTVTVNYEGITSQSENRDAFYAAEKKLYIDGAINKPIMLYRPFAQLNIGTTDSVEAKKAAFEPTQSEVTVKNVYTTLNLFTGAVGGDTAVTFAMADLPGADETFPVVIEDGKAKYLSMNYLLVSQVDKELVTVDFTVTDGSHSIEREFTNVPVQRNFRTNIYGKLLTNQTNFYVVIDSAYYKPDFDTIIDTDLYPSIDLGIEVKGKPVLFAPAVWGATEENPMGISMTAEEFEALDVEGYRLMTIAEGNMLIYNCTWEEVTVNGVIGYNVTGNGNTIFLPLYSSNDTYGDTRYFLTARTDGG